MKVHILKTYTNLHGRELNAGYIVNLFSDEAFYAIGKGYAIDIESDCKEHFKKVEVKKRKVKTNKINKITEDK